METILIKRELVEKALDQLKEAQRDVYVWYTQTVVEELEEALLSNNKTQNNGM